MIAESKDTAAPAEKLSLVDMLKRKLVYHEAKAGKLREVIAELAADPNYVGLYERIKEARQ